MPTCISCNYSTEDAPFCDECTPTTCYWCPASDVYYDDRYVYCSHGCEHTLTEYAHHHFYTILFNASPETILAHGGLRIELIIPDGTPITVYESLPDETVVPDSHILATHYTTQKSRVLENGVQYPPHEHAHDRADWSDGTIRETAVYAWPYTPTFTECELTWSDNTDNNYVIFSIPEHTVNVSSYEFLWCLGENPDAQFSIPYEKYEDELLFEPRDLQVAATDYGRPCDPDDLLLYRHR